jgi:hypothetical protein
MFGSGTPCVKEYPPPAQPFKINKVIRINNILERRINLGYIL